METKLKQEPVADGGGGMPELPATTDPFETLRNTARWCMAASQQDWEDDLIDIKTAASGAPKTILALFAQLASSQEALRVAREENELLKRENIELTNGGSLWRNRAISAETSLSGMDRLESPIEVALRERMQQAVATLNLLCAADRSTSIVSHAIRLLSPEGSSR